MFGVDFSEIALIFLIALVVLGPAKLPQVAATIGRWVGRARVMARQFREQLEQEANTLKDATDLRARPAPPPTPAPAPHTDGAAAAPDTAHLDAPVADSAPAEGPPQMDSAVRFEDIAAADEPPPAASPPLPEAALTAHAELAPEHLEHPAPLPAEPHERGA
jgi:sec-independent protein translocase protein TatB